MTLGNRGDSGPARAGRCLLVWLSGTSLLATVGRLTRPAAAPALHGSLAHERLDRALVELAALTLLGCLAWGWLALTVTVVEAVREIEPWVPPGGRRPGGRRPHRVHLPSGLRRLVLAACGVALTSGLAQPALAAGRNPGAGHDRGLTALVGLPLPDRAVAPVARVAPAQRSVVVRPGDCLWSIAARDLPLDAPGREVASRWHAVYAANRAVIGPDPDQLVPGQRLLLPRKEPS